MSRSWIVTSLWDHTASTRWKVMPVYRLLVHISLDRSSNGNSHSELYHNYENRLNGVGLHGNLARVREGDQCCTQGTGDQKEGNGGEDVPQIRCQHAPGDSQVSRIW
jgi:hypothetical protein